VKLPRPDPAIIARRPEILRQLQALLPADDLIVDRESLKVYDCDGLTACRQLPLACVLPRSTGQVAQVLRLCRELGVKVVPRGAGTSLSGGALPLADGVVLSLARLNRILEIDYANRCVVAQAGVTNLAISQAVAGQGFYYAPDPSSQLACTIGGNVAENAGGVHCLKYGLTTNNLLGVELVLLDGSVVRLGGKQTEPGGYDLLGVVTGSEGLLGVVTEVTVRILPRPALARALLLGFPSNEAAGACVAAIIGAGIIAAGLEMMDRLATEATEAFTHAGYPLDVETLLIVELDGPPAEVDLLVERVGALAEANGALSIRASTSEAERLKFWAGRKAAFPALGRLSPDYLCMDGTIPRGQLPAVLARIAALAAEHRLRVANVFHAGDGNLHPIILYDANRPGEWERAEALGAAILRLCVDVGGVLSGEHGIGVEKRELMSHQFAPADLDQQQRLKYAFDPEGLFNPGKVFPELRTCAELGLAHHQHPGPDPFPHLTRF